MSSAAVIAAIISSQRNYKPKPYPHEHYLVPWILMGWILFYAPVFYFTFSRKHYWILGPFRWCRNYEPKDKRLPKVVRKGDLKGRGHDFILVLLLGWPFLFIPLAYFDMSSKHYCYLGWKENGKIRYLTKTSRIVIRIYLGLLAIGFVRLILVAIAVF